MTGYDIVRKYWKTHMTGDFEDSWRKALNDGIIPNTAAQPKTVALSGSWTSQPVPSPAQNSQGQIEIVFKADPTIYDGRFANNGWLQELAKPLTKLTWENAALMSPATAQKLGLVNSSDAEEAYSANGKVIRISKGNLQIDEPIPVLVVVGHADNSITLPLGFGRSRSGRVGNGIGFNAYKIRS